MLTDCCLGVKVFAFFLHLCFHRFVPPVSSRLVPVFGENPRRKFFTFGVKPRDERGEGKNNKVFTLNSLCNSVIREVGEEVKAFF
jgi:hypothetical protein